MQNVPFRSYTDQKDRELLGTENCHVNGEPQIDGAASTKYVMT
jgi:hypothetical protein